MSIIKLEIESSKLDTVLHIIQNLKEDLIAKYEVVQDTQYNVEERSETKAFSNHTANLIEDWQDENEDEIWQ